MKAKSTINGVLKKKSLFVLNVQELSFLKNFKLQIQCTIKKKENIRSFC